MSGSLHGGALDPHALMFRSLTSQSAPTSRFSPHQRDNLPEAVRRHSSFDGAFLATADSLSQSSLPVVVDIQDGTPMSTNTARSARKSYRSSSSVVPRSAPLILGRDISPTGKAPFAPKLQDHGSIMPTLLQRMVSVRTFTTAISLLLIALTAAIVLAVTFTFSISAAQDLATAHTRVITSKAKGDIEAYLNTPIKFLDGWQYSLGRGTVPLPSDSPNYNAADGWSDPWTERLVAPMSATDFKLQYTAIGFADGNAAMCVTFPDNTETFRCQVFHWGNRNASNTSQTSTVSNTEFFKDNYTVAVVASEPDVYDPRTRGWYTRGKATGVMTWAPPFLSTVPTLPCISVSAAIFNRSGSFIGIASIFLNLDAMGALLGKLLAVPNVVSFLIDSNNLLLASTYNIPTSTTTNVTRGLVGGVSSNCLLSDTVNGAELDIMMCREGVSTYKYRPLQDLASSDPEYVANGETGGATRVLKLAGQRYYVAVVPIATPKASGMGWRFAMFLPEDEVTGGIVRGRNIAIFVCVGVVVVAAVVSLVTVALLLRPLDAIADHMYRAAMMQDLVEEDTISSLFEIATIQSAFNTMTAELAQIKSFLPQSVLEQLYGGTAQDEGDAEYHSRSMSCSSDTPTIKSTTIAKQSTNSTPTASSNGASLNTAVKMLTRKVTMLSLNVMGFQKLVGTQSTDELLAKHGRIVSAVSDACVDFRGVMDGFQGDRFLISFNAVTRAGNHAALAAYSAAAVSSGVWSEMSLLMTSGIASGPALVGNMGSAATKRFTVLSPMVNYAVLLERLGKKYSSFAGPVTMSGGAAMLDLDANFDLLTLDAIAIPTIKGDNATRRILVCAVMAAKEAAADEWMYEMAEGSKGSPYTACNEAFDLYLRGMIASATAIVDAQQLQICSRAHPSRADHPLVSKIFQHIQDLVRRAQEGDADPSNFAINYASSIPDYFIKCLLPTQ